MAEKAAPKLPPFQRQLSAGRGFMANTTAAQKPALNDAEPGAAAAADDTEPGGVAAKAKAAVSAAVKAAVVPPVASALAAAPVAAPSRPPPPVIRQRSLDAKTRDLFVRLDSTDAYDRDTLLTLAVVGGKALRLAELIAVANGTAKLTALQQQAKALQPQPFARPLPPAAGADAKSGAAAAAASGSIVVPSAVAVTTFAYDQHVVRCGLEKPIANVLHNADHMSLSEKEKALGSIRATLVATALDPALSAAIDAFVAKLPAGRTLAVRSSSTMEDQKGASFAGQYETYLNVPRTTDAVALAVRQCWASMWHPHILSYREQLSVTASATGVGGVQAPSMAVAVMAMLNPRCSGVLFTLNPLTGDTNQMVAESCWGLGEGVVCGEISPHTFTVDWTTGKVAHRSTPKQTKKFAFLTPPAAGAATAAAAGSGDAKGHASGGAGGRYIGLVPTTAAEQGGVSLSDADLQRLVALGLRVAAHYEHPQDLEWAIEPDGALYLLQCRPITTFELHDRDGCGYDYGGFTDRCFLSKTLTVEAYMRLIFRVRAAVAKAQGKQQFESATKMAMYRDFFGRFYLNSIMWQEYGNTLGDVQSLVPDHERHRSCVAFITATVKHFDSEEKKRLGVEKSMAALTDNELYAAYEWLRDSQVTMDNASFVIGDDVLFFEERVKGTLKYLVDNTPEWSADPARVPRIENLMGGVNEGSEGQKSFADLKKFADPIAANPKVVAWIQREAALAGVSGPLPPSRAVYAKLMADPLFAEVKFVEHFRAYVDRFYFMSDDDGDLQNLRFKNDPYIPWCIVWNLLTAAATPPAAGAGDVKVKGLAGDKKANAPPADATALYRRDLKTLVDLYNHKYTPESTDQLTGWIAALREGLLWKERVHIAYTLNHYFLRLVIVALTQRLANAVTDGSGVFGYSGVDGRYIDVDDVWQCEFPVLSRLLRPPFALKKRGAAPAAAALGRPDAPKAGEYRLSPGQSTPAALFEYSTSVGLGAPGGSAAADDAVAAWRHHLWVRGLSRRMYVAFPPPARLGGKKKITIATAADVKALKVGEAASGLACSPGQAVGRARVVATLEEAGAVQRGEVLITRYTQPSWTPLFSLIVAVVIEEGGQLAHSAIVARECGIPSVAQVKDAMRRFKTGDWVLVDGTAGLVSLADVTVKPAAAATATATASASASQ